MCLGIVAISVFRECTPKIHREAFATTETSLGEPCRVPKGRLKLVPRPRWSLGACRPVLECRLLVGGAGLGSPVRKGIRERLEASRLKRTLRVDPTTLGTNDHHGHLEGSLGYPRPPTLPQNSIRSLRGDVRPYLCQSGLSTLPVGSVATIRVCSSQNSPNPTHQRSNQTLEGPIPPLETRACAVVLEKARGAGSHEDRRVEQMSLKAINARCQNLKAVNAGPGPESSKCRAEARCRAKAQKWGRNPKASMKPDAVNVGPEPDAGPKPDAGPEPDARLKPNTVNACSIRKYNRCKSKVDAQGLAERCASDHAVMLSVSKKLVSVSLTWKGGLALGPQLALPWRKGEGRRWSTREGWHDSPVIQDGWPRWTASGHSTSRH
ncbi:hypothetical protein CDL15_Pgr027002 [Punica granatum]|uniref:Uncharacterized protein n=1 Tax=Punica granatum TaxID=22663 RepID=A0A218W1T9_PUNGR|nr:hypothetical protein CDL15_Pgr027002 [Punica granatum]